MNKAWLRGLIARLAANILTVLPLLGVMNNGIGLIQVNRTERRDNKLQGVFVRAKLTHVS